MNNAAAIGYMILAARRLGFKQIDIEWLSSEMKLEMDEATEEEAEEIYRNT